MFPRTVDMKSGNQRNPELPGYKSDTLYRYCAKYPPSTA